MVKQLLVFPEARRAQVAAVVGEELEHRGGTEALSLIVVRIARGWHVTASGLDDPVLERGFSDLLEAALKRAGFYQPE